ncbi:DUF397 domain-containing protein [Asanoa iriomotensis]|uniref:DUF397 domain-containing protein n=1 Tax=Asanoa iriomotensis TaxID=234613 RepID=A0ABQ4C6Z9_9ACTN|nr:DUF397 domain-containing protein [Asanoa iriomotensis]GIF58552.1 hypothetical protein Air01nite_46470 [Asanoa iriomotensis]
MTNSTTAPNWRKSSRCATGACVEVADVSDAVLMRDSKTPEAPALAFGRLGWNDFLFGVKNGEFDAN